MDPNKLDYLVFEIADTELICQFPKSTVDSWSYSKDNVEEDGKSDQNLEIMERLANRGLMFTYEYPNRLIYMSSYNAESVNLYTSIQSLFSKQNLICFRCSSLVEFMRIYRFFVGAGLFRKKIPEKINHHISSLQNSILYVKIGENVELY